MKSTLLFLSLLIMGCAQLTPTPGKKVMRNWGLIVGGELSSKDRLDEMLRNNAQNRMLEDTIRDLQQSALAELCILVNGKLVADFMNIHR